MSRSVFLSLLAVAVVATVGTALWASPADSPRQLGAEELWGIYGSQPPSGECCEHNGACDEADFGDPCEGVLQGMCPKIPIRKENISGTTEEICVESDPGHTCSGGETDVCCKQWCCTWDDGEGECTTEETLCPDPPGGITNAIKTSCTSGGGCP